MAATMNTLSRNFIKFTNIWRSNQCLTRDVTQNVCQRSSSLIRAFVSRKRFICSGQRTFSSVSTTDSQEADSKEKKANDEFSMEQLESILQEQSNELDKDMVDMPECDMKNPYEKPHKKCVICQYNIELDYKNSKLLSQFVSPYTGRIFGRHITGLCRPMQGRISHLIRTARRFGYMPLMFKDSSYLSDPSLFDPFKRVKHNESES
ncbi:uncharacterized protein LOC135489381 [Lineus longissimus]|uniref:uncharacterized protein LOC135489381 n=1 Tax=Lineus longissimus TaxID=88925 RepID=UPI002B4FAC0D